MQATNESSTSQAVASTTVNLPGPEALESTVTSSNPRNVEIKQWTKENIPEPGELVEQQQTSNTMSGQRVSIQLTTNSMGGSLSRLSSHLEPSNQLADPPPFWKSIYFILTASRLNVLLLCIPVSWAFHFAKLSDNLIFVFAFLAIIPLARLLAFATDELSMRVGQTLAGLLNATLGNAVELVVAIIALAKCELHIVQSSLVGSILSNLLLVLGMCFFAGGTRFSEQGFGLSSTQLNSSLLTLSVIAVLIPAAFHFAASSSGSSSDQLSESTENSDILKVSRGVAIVLLFIYGSFLVFQLFSHKSLYSDSKDNEDLQKTKKYERSENEHSGLRRRLRFGSSRTTGGDENADSEFAPTPDVNVATSAWGHGNDSDSELETPKMSLPVAIGLLVGITVLVAITADFLIDSINGLIASGRVSQEFVGVILLPIISNASDHVTAVTVSVKDKLTLSIGVAVGSSIQIALFVVPFIVTLGWIMGKPLTLLFDPLESVVLFFAVLTVSHVTQDGKSYWLEGMILMCLYVVCAITFWYHPGSSYPITCT